MIYRYTEDIVRLVSIADPRFWAPASSRYRDSADGKSIEYPVTIDRSVTERPWRVPEPLPEGLETGDSSRKDAGKDAGFWLVPYVGLRELARTYKIGADKYQPRGWEKGMAWSRVVDPMFRHLFKWLRGEKYDQVDGQHHLAAVAWACFASDGV
jgi:hypothetical protein